MKNPCKGCIVDPICREGCDKLERYIFNLFGATSVPDATYFRAADDVRKGILSIEYYEGKNEPM